MSYVTTSVLGFETLSIHMVIKSQPHTICKFHVLVLSLRTHEVLYIQIFNISDCLGPYKLANSNLIIILFSTDQCEIKYKRMHKSHQAFNWGTEAYRGTQVENHCPNEKQIQQVWSQISPGNLDIWYPECQTEWIPASKERADILEIFTNIACCISHLWEISIRVSLSLHC